MPFLPCRHFLPWDRPLLPQAVRVLAGAWTGFGPLDLSRMLVVVPTRQSGRRLREALAGFAAAQGTAAFPPRVITPEALVALARQSADPSLPRVGSKLEMLLAWAEVLRAADPSGYRDVFPVDPPARNFTWAVRLAEQFLRLQTTLAENDLRIGDVADRAGPDFPEWARWRQLADLERLFAARLRQAVVRSPFDVSAQPGARWLADIDRITLLGTADPLPTMVSLLSAATVPVDVLVFADPGLADHFDAWGRPLAASWASRPVGLLDFEARVHLCADPSVQASRIADLARAYSGTRPAAESAPPPNAADGMLAVGVADPDVASLLEGEAARHGFAVFNPEGSPRRGGALHHLLVALAECVRTDGSFEAVESLARCPDFLAHLRQRLGPEFSAAGLLSGLDRVRQRHLPADLRSAREHVDGLVAASLDVLSEVLDALGKREFPASLAATLANLFAGRSLDLAQPEDAQLHDAATAWTSVARECVAASEAFPGLAAADWWELALGLFGDSRRPAEKPSDALEVHGWLEVLFEDAPHLVLAGCNDGLVPESVVEDPFLPESLRAKIGLRTNAARFARDAYLLEAVAACRRDHGRLDVLFGKVSAAGDPLRPSRLLLRCPDPDLPPRIAFLFSAPDAVGSNLAWRRAWRLRPRVAPVPKQVAVTSLRRWLACPFRFYLKYVLRMESVDPAKSEMDPFDFGSLCHLAFEAMGSDPAMRECTDAGVLREFLLAELNRHAHARFGTELALPLLIQLESARQRLSKLAEIQAAERTAGWVIQEVERPFQVEVGGLVVKGKIDRIDRNLETGAVRVLDYKTSDTAVAPRSAHTRTLRPGESVPDWSIVSIDGRLRAWTDLQLPLYRHAVAAQWGSSAACGYVNLPKAVGQTAVSLWDDYTPELQAAAMRCAEGVCGAIARGEFWPPNEDIRADGDDFAALFQHGVAASVEWGLAPGETKGGIQ